MKRISRLVVLAAALVLAGSIIPTAQADTSRTGEMAVSCPSGDEVSAILGGTTTASTRQASRCGYARDTGRVDFEFVDDTLAAMRASIESSGTSVTELVELGSGAFGHQPTDAAFPDTWIVHYEIGNELATIRMPLSQKDEAVAVGNLFKSASAPWVGRTVPAKSVQVKCPTAQAISRIVGETHTAKPNDSDDCNYERADAGSTISYSVDRDFGLVTEERINVELSLKYFTVTTYDFGGLGNGAYAWADASPTLLTWQVREGVVAKLWSWFDNDINRRLAVLFNDAQDNAAAPATPSKPGLPSTGN